MKPLAARRAVVTRQQVTALILLPCFVVACHRWVPATQPTAVVAGEGPRGLRLTLTDGTRITLRQASLAGDSIVGIRVRPTAKVRTAVALGDVAAVEVTELSTPRTVVATALGLAAAGLLVVGLALAINPPFE